MNPTGNPRLAVRNVAKTLAGVRVLDSVTFELCPGEVHVLLGEKGSGKSSLIRALAGVSPADSGQIVVDGICVKIRTPQDAAKSGICAIHQRSSLVPHLSIAENILLGREPMLRSFSIVIDGAKLVSQSIEIMERLHLTIDPRKRVEELSVGERRLVEIAKGVVGNARILAVDEAASSLSTADMLRFFEILQELKKWGVAIVYGCRRLEEAEAIGDRATVLRAGRSVATVGLKETSVTHLMGLMMGPEMTDEIDRVSEHHRLLVKAMDVREEERRKIALDIHDGVAQYMAQALHQMQATERSVASHPLEAAERLESIEALLKQTISEIRKMMFNLHPATLERGELVSSLCLYARSFQQLCDIECTVQVIGAGCPLRHEVEATAFRIVQEALHNVHKHSLARSVQVTVEFQPSQLRISVHDDGRGFDKNVAPAPGCHWGLIGMRERAKAAGGHVDIDSAPGLGACVALQLPLKRQGLASRGKLLSMVKAQHREVATSRLEAVGGDGA